MSHMKELDIFLSMAPAISFSTCEIGSESVFYVPPTVGCLEILLSPKRIILVAGGFIVNQFNRESLFR